MSTSSMQALFSRIKSSFDIRRTVEIADGIKIELGPLTSIEELKILEACKSLEGASYIEALKKHSLAYGIKKINDVDFGGQDSLEIEKDDGTKETLSNYLFLLGQVENWPTSLRDTLFDAHRDVQLEMDALVEKKVTFTRFTPEPKAPSSEPVKTVDIPDGFKKVEESNEPEDDMEKLNKQVTDEIRAAQQNMDKQRSEKVEDAEQKLTRERTVVVPKR